MHIQTCLHPKLIRNPKDGSQVYVPCGSCPACLKARSSRWVQRLNQERYCWKYSVFFTLTFDNENLPRLKRIGNHLVDVKHLCTPPDKEVLVIDIDEAIFQFSRDDARDNDWLTRINREGLEVPVLSSYLLQKFIKRFRTNLHRSYERYKKEFNIEGKNENLNFRYFAIGEYGETLLRPHYHGLYYFNSEYLANHVADILRASWRFGRVDSSFVSESNAKYVAQYLNCTTHLPSIYRVKQVRPFFICSKFPPIGTLCHSSKEIREIFFSATPEFVLFDHGRNAFDNVPLWRTYIDRLYPKLSGFDEISHIDRVALYGIVSKKGFGSFSQFFHYCQSGTFASERSSLIDDYCTYICANCNNVIAGFQRWYYISSRVARQADVFEISVRDYVKVIEKFYQNVEKDKLKRYYEFQSDFAKDYGSDKLVGLDVLWLKSLMDCDVVDIAYEDLCLLSSYGVDIDKFFSDDEKVRIAYQKSLLPENTWDFHVFEMDSESWLSRTTKTKVKNDYLEAHPEYKNFIY